MIEICAIVKNESAYLKEWIEHHFKLGFDRIVLYNNGSVPSLYDDVELWKSLSPADQARTIIKLWTEDHAQTQCYAHHAHFSTADWTAFIDIDEFIILNGYKDIKAMIEAVARPGYTSIRLYWEIYGANGHKTKPEGLGVMEAYTLKSFKQVPDHFKTIAMPGYVNHFPDPHQAQMNAGLSIDPPPFGENRAWINHYYTKSLEEWRQKIARGRADGGANRTEEEFYEFNPEMK